LRELILALLPGRQILNLTILQRLRNKTYEQILSRHHLDPIGVQYNRGGTATTNTSPPPLHATIEFKSRPAGLSWKQNNSFITNLISSMCCLAEKPRIKIVSLLGVMLPRNATDAIPLLEWFGKVKNVRQKTNVLKRNNAVADYV